jgi:RNA polymerase sigma-70 factor (ECF subfamily)
MPERQQPAEESVLVVRARWGDEQAFERIVEIYGRRIVAYCHRMAGGAAEDLAQEIFVKLYLSLDRFDTSKPLAPFLFRIAHNHCLDALRRRKIQTVSLVRDEDEREVEHAGEGPSPEEAAGRAEVVRAVEEALGELAPEYRSVLVLYHVQGMSYEQIAEALGLPMGTVKARIHRGRERLQQKLRDHVLP